MSYTVSAATAAAASASISTPVRSSASTRARMSSLPFPANSNSTSIFVVAIGWHSGIRSAVRLAAEIPAIRATESTSPFFAAPRRMIASVAGFIRTTTPARAVRCVTGFSPTSTMRAAPERSRWVSRAMSRLSRISLSRESRPASVPIERPPDWNGGPDELSRRSRRAAGRIRRTAPGSAGSSRDQEPRGPADARTQVAPQVRNLLRRGPRQAVARLQQGREVDDSAFGGGARGEEYRQAPPRVPPRRRHGQGRVLSGRQRDENRDVLERAGRQGRERQVRRHVGQPPARVPQLRDRDGEADPEI